MIDMEFIKNIRSIVPSEAVDNDLKERVLKTLRQYNMPYSSFIFNLRSIMIYKSNEISSGNYDCKRNRLTYYGKQEYLHELFHVASSNGKTNGIVFEKNGVNVGVSLNEGITDLFSMRAGNSDFRYHFEMFCAHIVEITYGKDIFRSYFESDSESFYKGRAELFNLVYALDDYHNSMLNIYSLYSIVNNNNYSEKDEKSKKEIAKKINEEIRNAVSYAKESIECLCCLPNIDLDFIKNEIINFDLSTMLEALRIDLDDLFQMSL